MPTNVRSFEESSPTALSGTVVVGGAVLASAEAAELTEGTGDSRLDFDPDEDDAISDQITISLRKDAGDTAIQGSEASKRAPEISG